MSDLAARVRITRESRERVQGLTFGEPVTNVCAGEGNPLRHAFFVRVSADTVEVTDKKGQFARFGCEVIYPGHLSTEQAAELFEPFWQAMYGSPTTVGEEHV